MTASMHLAWHLAGIGHPGLLMDRQRVHVGAQPDHPASRVGLALDHHHNTGAANALGHFIAAETPAEFSHLGGGAMHVKQQLGVLVEILPPSGDLGQHLGETVLDGHDGSPLHHDLSKAPPAARGISRA
ncbi:MAG: hypothetical protein ACD_54C00840G0001, partial [uncultured bacterium]